MSPAPPVSLGDVDACETELLKIPDVGENAAVLGDRIAFDFGDSLLRRALFVKLGTAIALLDGDEGNE